MLWAYDIETENWDQLVLGAAVSEDGQIVIFRDYDQFRAWYKHDLQPSDVAIAHNGGRYDALMAVDALKNEGALYVTLSGSAIASLQCEKHAELIDSARVCPMTLEKFAEGFAEDGSRKLSLGLECRGAPFCGVEACGGYCQIRRDAPRYILDRVEAYCVNDCKVTLDAYLGLLRFAANSGINIESRNGIRRTIGGWAFASAIEETGIENRALPFTAYRSQRLSYYGGRTECFQWEVDHGYRYDIRSAYPAAMREGFPSGPQRAVTGRSAIASLAKGLPGTYRAVVKVPQGVPLLPMRGDNGIVWGTGTIEGTWNRIELDAAIEAGAKVDKVISAICWRDEKPILKPFIDRYWNLRETADKEGNKPRSSWCKLFLNSLSGKLAQRAGGSARVAINPPIVEDNWTELSPGSNVWAIPIDRVPNCARPILASTITARTRARLLRRLIQAGDGSIYCDTDSVYQTSPSDIDIGSNLGQWEFEGEMFSWLCPAPKMYTFDTTNSDDEVITKARAKGIPNATGPEVHALWCGDRITRERGVRTFKTALRSKDTDSMFVRRSLTRSLRADPRICGRRARLDRGRTVPLHRNPRGVWSWPGVDLDPCDFFNDLP